MIRVRAKIEVRGKWLLGAATGLAAWACIALLLTILTSCQPDTLLEVPSPFAPTLSFSLPTTTRAAETDLGGMQYDISDGAGGQLKAGSLVGCVVAFKNSDGSLDYQANSCWKLTDNGHLELTKIFGPNSDSSPAPTQLSLTNDGVNATDPTYNSIIRHKQQANVTDPNSSSSTKYDIELLNSSADYQFFFYYPYVDKDIVAEKIGNKLSGDQMTLYYPDVDAPNAHEIPAGDYTDYYYTNHSNISNKSKCAIVAYNSGILMPCISEFEKSGIADSYYDSHEYSEYYPNYYSWQSLPVAPMVNFKENGLTRLSNSDFMYAAVTELPDHSAINEGNLSNVKGNIQVKMKRQMTTMDFVFAEKPSEFYLNIADDWNGRNSSMTRVKEFDLSKGHFTNKVFNYNQYGSGIDKMANYPSTFYPYYMGEDSQWTINGVQTVYVYRIILTPQDKVQCNFSVTINGNELTLTKPMQSNPRLAKWESGHYYKIRFNKLNNSNSGWDLVIDDLRDGGEQAIERPDPDE